MKKTRSLLCMLLVAVMLLGAIPAHAATPMTAAASLIALPLSGKLFTALPVSDSKAKVFTVEEIENTYSTETKSASTPAPVEQTTSATAPANRLPDGTTGATEGLAGKTIGATIGDNGIPVEQAYTSCCKSLSIPRAEANLAKAVNFHTNPGKARILLDPRYDTNESLVGLTIPGGLIVDVYKTDASVGGSVFVCQYDTRDGNPFTITVAPGASASTFSVAKAPAAPTKASYTDVKPGNWYYEAVTALIQNNVIGDILPADANGNFNPDAPITREEAQYLDQRIYGKDMRASQMIHSQTARTRYEAMISVVGKLASDKARTALTADEAALAVKTNAAYYNSAERAIINISKSDAKNQKADLVDNPGLMPTRYYNVWKNAVARPNAEYYSHESQSADAKAIRELALKWANDPSVNCNRYPIDYYCAGIEENFRRAYNLGLVRFEGMPEIIDFSAPVTRAEYCVMLYRAGLTSFGCCTAP